MSTSEGKQEKTQRGELTAAPAAGEHLGDKNQNVEAVQNDQEPEEMKLTLDINTAQEAQVMERHILKETEASRELSTLREKEYYVNDKQMRLLQDYDNLSSSLSETLIVLQRLQDERKGLQRRLTDLELQSASLRTKSKEAESRVESIRFGGNVSRKFFLSEVSKQEGKYCKDIQRFKESEQAKRVKLEAEVKLHAENLETEKSKLLCQICMNTLRDTMILPCTHFLY